MCRQPDKEKQFWHVLSEQPWCREGGRSACHSEVMFSESSWETHQGGSIFTHMGRGRDKKRMPCWWQPALNNNAIFEIPQGINKTFSSHTNYGVFSPLHMIMQCMLLQSRSVCTHIWVIAFSFCCHFPTGRLLVIQSTVFVLGEMAGGGAGEGKASGSIKIHVLLVSLSCQRLP